MVNQTQLYLSFVIAGLFSSFGVAEAATITHTTSATNTFDTVYGIRDDTATRGVDLDGAIVTAQSVSGATETVTWQALDAWTNGNAVGSAFDIFMGWEGFELSTTSVLASLTLNLAAASSLFDMSHSPEGQAGNTPTSHFGFPLELYGTNPELFGEIAVNYSGIVSLNGAPAEGDLFTTMTIDFTGLSGGGFFW